jgi:hypothetical protein
MKPSAKHVASRHAGLRVASYFRYERGMPLQQILDKWQAGREKMYDEDYVLVPVRDLWPHREYTWRRDLSRSGEARVKGKRVELPGPLKWDAMVVDMRTNGWDPKEPAHFTVGHDGAKVGEGNHRLAIAKKLGIQKVPVQFHFVPGRVTKDPQAGPVTLDPPSVKKVVERQLEKADISPEQDAQLDGLLGLLGF